MRLLLAALLLCLPALLAQEQQPAPDAKAGEKSEARRPPMRGPRGDFAGRRLEILTERLKLTPGQVAKLKPIFAEHEKKMTELRERGRASAGSANAETEDVRAARRDEMVKLREANDAQIEAVLTDAQKAEMKKLRDEQRERMRGNWERRQKGPGPGETKQ